MNHRSVFAFLAAATATLVGASEAMALTQVQAQACITQKRNANTWVGTQSGSIIDAPNGNGWYATFSGSSDATIWIPNTAPSSCADGAAAAHIVQGLIRWDYTNNTLNNILGFPTTDELDTYDDGGKVGRFQTGSIFYKWGRASAAEVHGYIGTKYSKLGAERSVLGYPTSNEHAFSNSAVTGRYNSFEKGKIIYESGGTWHGGTWPVLNATTVYGGSLSTNLFVSVDTYHQNGATVSVYAEGFTPGSDVTFYVNDEEGSHYWSPETADANGNIEIDEVFFQGLECGFGTGSTCILTIEARDSTNTKFAVGAVDIFL